MRLGKKNQNFVSGRKFWRLSNSNLNFIYQMKEHCGLIFIMDDKAILNF